MKLVELDFSEFEKFARTSNQFSFHQTKEWADLKQCNHWDSLYLGLKEGEKIVAGCLILKKTIFLHQSLFYSPRGFLIDYQNLELLSTFTKEIHTYCKKNGAIFVKIDPYVIYQERDKFGNIIEGGINHADFVANLKSLGYRHYGFSISTEKELQPRWIYVLPLKGKTKEEVFQEFSSDTKRYIHRAEKSGLVTEEIALSRLEEFQKVMEHTSKRRGFIDRPLSYYEEMMKCLKEHIKIITCSMDTVSCLKNLEIEEESLKKEILAIDEKLSVSPDSKKSKVAKKTLNTRLDELTSRKKAIRALQESYGDKILMASSMFIIYPNEVIYLYSGSFDEFMKYNPQYLIQAHMIDYAISHNISRYNFYGIDGNFDKEKNPMYGIYEFKRGFGGNVEELIGEFDLVIRPVLYYSYKLSFALYKGLKKLRLKRKVG